MTRFDGGQAVRWFDDFGVLRLVSVAAGNGTVREFPGLPSLAGGLALGMPADLIQGVMSHWASARELSRGPWIYASQTTVLTFEPSDGSLRSVDCPGAACLVRARITEGRLVRHENPTTFAECGWSGIRIVDDVATPIRRGA
ncbi:hypothetical protein AB0H71_28200 [Nocardia sp. NPDC050697]|uniref:hypothetical protein n=1 Tax=Nocardia sp. NPDC050697 TaxID=3155158 RepID=UPI0033E3DD9E